jgi:hypothetical protein
VRLAAYPYGSPAIEFRDVAAFPAVAAEGQLAVAEAAGPDDPAHAGQELQPPRWLEVESIARKAARRTA